MDSESSLALLALLLALVAFTGVNLSEAALRRVSAERGGAAAGGATRRMASREAQFVALFPSLRLLSSIAVVLATVALILSVSDVTWLIVAGVVVLLLVLLGLLRVALLRIGGSFASPVLGVTSPFIVGIEWVSRPFLRLSSRWAWPAGLPSNRRLVPSNGEGAPRTTEELSTTPLMQEAVEAGERERRMIRAILRLEDIMAREVMVPRVDIVAVEASTPLTAVSDLMSEGGHSRIPIYDETIDKIVGIVHARDLLRHLGPGTASARLTLRDVARPAVFIPDSKPLDELLREFQERRVTVAIVVDEYGGTEGLLTMEDLVEEIVGEIEDEFETEENDVVWVNQNEVIVDARATLEDLTELFHTTLEGDGFDTLGGLLYTRLGKIPVPGDELSLDGMLMRVLSTTGRRIRKVRILRKP